MPAKTFSRYGTSNPDILSGEPIIAGTRTLVRVIVGLWRLGTMPEEIPNHLPHLTLGFHSPFKRQFTDFAIG